MRRVGFRAIDNDLFRALIAAKLLGSVYQVILVVIDRTLGFQREKAAISLTDFEEATRLSRRGVTKAVNKAEAARIIMVERNSTRETTYALNRDPRTWLTSEPQFPSGLVNHSSLDWGTSVPKTRELVKATTVAIKERKKTLKKEGSDLSDDDNPFHIPIIYSGPEGIET